MEGNAGQGRQGQLKVRRLREATVNPSEPCEGVAPSLKKREDSNEEEPSQTQEVVACAEEENLEVEHHVIVCIEEEFGSGHDIIQAVGSRLTGLLSAGCLLAWMICKAGGSRRSGAWSWIAKVAFDKSLSAASREGSRKAASFPVRVGDLRGLVERLRSLSIEEMLNPMIHEEIGEDCWLLCALTAANFLAGCGGPLEAGRWSVLEQRGVATSRAAVKRLLKTQPGPLECFEKVGADLARARVGYDGEELGTCEPLSLEQVLPALPPVEHGGSIPLEEILSRATRELLGDPRSMLREDFTTPKPKIPANVHFARGERMQVCCELTRRNICVWIRSEEVAVFKGVRILNGMFGVKKPASLPNGKPVLRVIMNLKPSNAILRQVKGAVGSLPSIACFQATVLDEGEELVMGQSDMSSAFYLFRLPRVWQPYLCFNVHCDGAEIGQTAGCSYTLSCAVLPMGWNSSVSIMQEVSERILWNAGFSEHAQIRRGFAMPEALTRCARQAIDEDKAFWQVYLDNYMGGQKLVSGECPTVCKTQHDRAEAAWKEVGIVSSQKKRVENASEVEELGALIQGQEGYLGGSNKRFCKLIQATCWVLSRKVLDKKQAQVIAGRWVHVLQFRRPGMSFLDRIWGFISATQSGNDRSLRVKRELLMVMLAIPLLHTSLGASVDTSFWCSDASESGGAIACAERLSDEGKDFLMSVKLSNRTLGTAPILVVGLFSGIGGTFRIYDILDIIPQASIAVDIHKPANRIVSRRWPGVKILRDVRDITREVVQEWAHDFHTVTEVHLWAGFPCRDLSSARANRANLEGRDSGLFFEFLRIWQLLSEEFSEIQVKAAAENVASMDESASEEISSWMGVRPYHLDSLDAVPMRRRRLCWTSERVEGCLDGLKFIDERRWCRIEAKAPYPLLSQWLEKGAEWPGEFQVEGFPTCMRAVAKESPPKYPAGLNRADRDCQDRWAASKYIYPPYQFRNEFLIWRNGKWRLLDSEERGLLMGYGFGHCRLAWSASQIKQNRHQYELEKCSLVGDAFSVYSFVIIGAALARNFMPQVHYQHLARRLGVAPGFRASLRLQAPLARRLQYGCQNLFHAATDLTVQELNKFFLGRANFTGSDVRVTSGDIVNPRSFPRQPVCADWWTWGQCIKFRWKQSQHINLLELKTILLSVQRGIERQKWGNIRVFHATDSYISMSVVSKGRTSSQMLNRLLKMLNAMLLLHGVHLLVTHVESSENPTDAASRS